MILNPSPTAVQREESPNNVPRETSGALLRRKRHLWDELGADRKAALKDTEWLHQEPLQRHLNYAGRMYKTNNDCAISVLSRHGDALPDAAWTCIIHLLATLDQQAEALSHALTELEKAEPEAARVPELLDAVQRHTQQIEAARKRLKRRKQQEHIPTWLQDSTQGVTS